MREIKFRAWDGHKMRTDFTMHSDGQVIISASVYAIGFKPVLMQYTGLKDQNGKGTEMCQGDLVRASGHGIGKVDKNGWGEWELVFNDGTETIHDLIMEQDLGEIVGTIYENPELLESK